jgi:AcrR family transcriptional regulator
MKQPVRRRQPIQDRAQKTQLLIFETAAKLLELEGLEAFNTNRLAEVSGFSVGTIYQYFADKRAILLALAQHEQGRAMQEVRRLLMTDLAHLSSEDEFPRLRAIVRAIVHTFSNRQHAHKVLSDLALNADRYDRPDSPGMALSALLTSGVATGKDGIAPTLTEIDAFVLTQSVIGSVRAAVVRDVRMLKKPQFEDALVGLITGFVRARRERV